MQKISKDRHIYEMSAFNEPALIVENGTKIQFETMDALAGQIGSNADGFEGLDWSRINPATGPVYIKEANPGDILAVHIHKIDIAKTGVVICGKGMGVMGDMLTASHSRILPINHALLASETVTYSENITLPANKMIGVIGVAPAEGKIACGVPDFHGGNMDCKKIREGATLYLPVFVPGALLALGDLHAVMADGEIGVSGVEVSGTVTVSVEVIKNKPMPTPMLMDEHFIMTIASDEDLDVAVNMAVSNMITYLTTTEAMPAEDAIMLSSLTANVRICQVVDPKKTVRVEFPKKYLPSVLAAPKKLF